MCSSWKEAWWEAPSCLTHFHSHSGSPTSWKVNRSWLTCVWSGPTYWLKLFISLTISSWYELFSYQAWLLTYLSEETKLWKQMHKMITKSIENLHKINKNWGMKEFRTLQLHHKVKYCMIIKIFILRYDRNVKLFLVIKYHNQN